MRVTKLKSCKKSSRVNVYVDDKYTFTASRNLISDKRLFVGKEIDSELIDEIRNDDLKVIYLERVYALLARRPRSEKEVRLYLNRKLSKEKVELIEEIISKLKEQKHINDKEFAEWWVKNRLDYKARGRYLLRTELMQKGIDKTVIEKELEKLEPEKEFDMCLEMARRKIEKVGSIEELKAKKKVMDFLLRKGFSYTTVKSVLKKLQNKSDLI